MCAYFGVQTHQGVSTAQGDGGVDQQADAALPKLQNSHRKEQRVRSHALRASRRVRPPLQLRDRQEHDASNGIELMFGATLQCDASVD
jgi:hypothetical protein